MSGAAIRARGIEKRFASVTALRGVDLDLAAGAALAILGPNGAGKSTLLRILAGLMRATSGSVAIGDGAAPRRSGPAARAQIGFVGHATLLYNELDARENLVFAGRLYGVPDPVARADQLLEEEGLADATRRLAGTFSRGMAQRLSIARALVHDPALMLLDEPFTGLDRRSAERLADRLTCLHGEGRTLVLVTHQLALASQIADSAVVLVGGAVAHRATGEALAVETLESAYLDVTDGAGRAA